MHVLWRFSNVTVQDLLEDSRRAPAASRVHGLPPPADGGGGRARERGDGLGGTQLAAGPLVAGQGDAGCCCCVTVTAV